jgi:hypothetical protein
MRKTIVWCLRIAAVYLRSPLQNFDIRVPGLAQKWANLMSDGRLSDEDSAEILDDFADAIDR